MCDAGANVGAELMSGSNALGASAGADATLQAGSDAATKTKKNFLRVLWDFTRPHTIIGSVLSVVSLHLFAATSPELGGAVNLSALGRALVWALIPASLINLYITGLNQIYDVDIDKINKPFLPIAAGDLSLNWAKVIVTASLILGLVPAWSRYPYPGLGGPLMGTLVASAALGTAYSAPPLRLKRFPLFAAMCIIVVRGTVINLGFYAHAAAVLGGSLVCARAIWAASFFGLFGCVIALMKDVPDILGDRENSIRTLSVRLGGRAVIRIAAGILSATLAAAAAALIATANLPLPTLPCLALRVCRTAAGAFAAAASWWVVAAAQPLLAAAAGPSDSTRSFSDRVYAYYMDLWKIFYAAYLFLPVAL